MAAEMHQSKLRNFASWSVAGGLLSALAIALGSWARNGDAMRAFVKAGTVNGVVLAVLIGGALVIGLTSMTRRFSWPRFALFAFFMILSAATALTVITGLKPIVAAGSLGVMDVSRWAGVGAGLVLVALSLVVMATVAVAQRGWTFDEPERMEMLRERSRLMLVSLGALAGMGLMLVLLSLAGPGSQVPREAALAGFVALGAVTVLLSILSWRMMDELDRTLSYETGNMAFYLIMVIGGGWAVLAHLGFVGAPQSLDWVTMLTLFSLVASFIVMGRRRLLAG